MLAALLLVATPALALPAPFFDARAATALPLAADALDSDAAVSLIAYFPRITSPAKGDVFHAGGALEVAWNATRPNYPENQIHAYAQVFLGFLDDEDPSTGYNLDIDHPLGNVSFYGGSGKASLPLPANLPTRSTYLITMGSTNNISPLFTIERTPSSASSSSSSSAAASSPPTSSTPASSATSSPQIEARPVTVYFPDGDSTVMGGAAAAATSTAAAPAGTALHDIAAGSVASSSAVAAAEANEPISLTASVSAPSASAAASSPSAATSAAAPSSAVGSAPSAAAAAAGSTSTSGAGRTLLSIGAVALAGVAALLAL
ncbi:hypothetical protein JCM3770_007325 [Rhodotorula araucariae]